MKIGFTGTQRGMSPSQAAALRAELSKYSGEFHHGDCIGADVQAHQIALELGYQIHIHPPTDPRKRAFCTGILYPTKSYMKRNEDIVACTTLLIAAPRSTEKKSPRSGTWATIRRANAALLIIWPEGEGR